MHSDRTAPAWVTALLVLIGVVLIVVGIVYFAETARDLPSFFPGHKDGRGGHHHHVKHGIAAVVVGLVAFAGAWFTSGTKKRQRS